MIHLQAIKTLLWKPKKFLLKMYTNIINIWLLFTTT